MNSPALVQTPPQYRAHFPAYGGNLARPDSTRTGHFSFQPLQQISGSFTDPNEAVFLPVYAAPWRAGRHNRRSACPAESRTSFPFHQVNHLTHSALLSSTSRKREHRRSPFHEIGKVFHDGHC
jgi:hypothetical protein